MARPSWFQVRSAGAKLAIALVIGSVIAWLTPGTLGFYLPLTPGFVIDRFGWWQPLTYTFLARNPLGVIFGAIILWSIGSALEASWGQRRFLVFSIGCTAVAGVLTVLLSLVARSIWGLTFSGGEVMTSVIWVAYGLSLGRTRVNFWGMFPVSGNILALIGAGYVLLLAAYAGPREVAPDLIGLALTVGYLRLGRFQHIVLRFQSWRFRRQLKARSSHLRVIAKDQNTSDGSDRYLH